MKKIAASAAALALVVTPTLAAAQTATPAEIAPASESAEGQQLRGGFIIPLIAIVAIILGILAATNDDDDDLPHSP